MTTTQSPALRKCTTCYGSGKVSYGRFCSDCGGFGYSRVPRSAPATLSEMALAVIFHTPAEAVPPLPAGFKFIEMEVRS
jgi:uncharacterized paraquat-inducible protein A